MHVGGLVPENIGGARVELYRGDELVGVNTVSARGRFTFSGVEPAEYQLSLWWEGREIQLSGVHIE